MFSRLRSAQIEREFGQSLVIDNRAGGASVIGTRAVAEAAPDGYTIGMMDSAFFTNPGLLKDKLPYDTRKDFITVSLLSRTQPCCACIRRCRTQGAVASRASPIRPPAARAEFSLQRHKSAVAGKLAIVPLMRRRVSGISRRQRHHFRHW